MTMNNQFDPKYVIEARELDIYYGTFKAVTNVNLKIERNAITAIIGPSGCGKSTLLRAINRMNELYAGTSVQGEVTFDGQDIYARDVDPVEVRYRIGTIHTSQLVSYLKASGLKAGLLMNFNTPLLKSALKRVVL